MTGQRPRVVLLHSSDDWYGSDRMAWESAQALLAVADVTVCVPDDYVATAPASLSNRLRRAGVGVEQIPMPVLRRANLRFRGMVSLLVAMVQFWRSLPDADVYIANGSALAPCLPVLRLRRGRRILVHLHETLSSREGRILGLALRMANQVLTVSKAAHANLPAGLKRKAIVLPNVVSSAELVPLPAPEPLRAVFVGRWTPRKGVAELVRVWARLDPSRFRLSILGGFPVSGTPADFDAEAADLLEHVDVVGEVDDPTPYLDAAHVVVLPSLLPEGLPMVGLEALSRGRPLVATALGGLDELVSTETGWVLEVDPDRWEPVFKSLRVEDVAVKQEACVALCRATYSRERYVEGLRRAVEGG